ncbi:hypothetical protein DXG03_000251 [Asterophora parasitica]|uniref:Alpha/beta hydrolase fold-3 domain-containing protein n=1 Tax=Asterophora parasitica TaxID=117018 RepID=A0A9P7GE35_9AGAR|nr:hypothetical protein DXG03_000251 [Asterophora parasitica]
MPVTTTTAAVHIAPVVVKTFVQHGKRKAKNRKEEQEADAKDDMFFDQAFHIVKAFIEMGTKNTVESLQAFTNTHVPAPPWAAVAPVLIPLSSCNRAADILMDWFGPEELKHVVGGERWWQVRGLDGIDAEWITEKEYLSAAKDYRRTGRKLSDDESTILRMDDLDTVMLYVHGGGYFWGSINTHRYQIIRYARKFKGRAFAVNYRKSPQYPWPCPLQDVIAAYLYLTQPPPHALHRAIPPSKIVFAGDSAGGGLCLTVLTILRDLGLTMPAGAVLISPWVDLTHSFPSIMENADTDIIPQHGFLAKPSTLWPVDSLPDGSGRVVLTKTNPPPKPGHSDTLKPSKKRLEAEATEQSSNTVPDQNVKAQSEMLKGDSPEASSSQGGSSPRQTSSENHSNSKPIQDDSDDYNIDLWEPKPPKVLMNDSNEVPLELRSQIQLYATTEQLSHPLVSPVLQGSLGNLPPLYILAGNDEVLRDEIAKCAYRSIAEFVKHVSRYDAKHLERNPFPELHRPPTEILVEAEANVDNHSSSMNPTSKHSRIPAQSKETWRNRKAAHAADVKIYKRNEEIVAEEVEHGEVDVMPQSRRPSSENSRNKNILMIRERVDINGISRPMEPPEEIRALALRPGEVGIIKEGPTRRWLEGQEQWDHEFKRSAKRAMKRRYKLELKAERLIDNARLQGLILTGEATPQELQRTMSNGYADKLDRIQDERRWGPLDLDGERPPPSAIAKRRDTPEALALLKKSIYHTAPITHKTVPKLRASDAIRATFDPNDDPNRPPKQSVSEQQVRTHFLPMHGLRMWDSIIRYFGKETSKKTKQVGEQLGIVNSAN